MKKLTREEKMEKEAKAFAEAFFKTLNYVNACNKADIVQGDYDEFEGLEADVLSAICNNQVEKVQQILDDTAFYTCFSSKFAQASKKLGEVVGL